MSGPAVISEGAPVEAGPGVGAEGMPVPITQQRITATGMALLGLGLFLLGAGSNTSNNVLYLLGTGCLSLLIVGLVQSRRNLDGLDLSVIGTPEGFSGNTVYVTVELRDRAGRGRRQLSFGSEYLATLPEHTAFPGKATVVLSGRGQQPLPPLTIQSLFPLGLFEVKRTVAAGSAWVWPRPLTARLSRSVLGQARVDRDLGDTSGDYWMHRPYQADEDARLIDWRATARSPEEEWVIVRTNPGGLPVRWWLAPGAATGAALEEFLGRAATVLWQFHQRQEVVLLWLPDLDSSGRWLALREADNLRRAMRWLAAYESTQHITQPPESADRRAWALTPDSLGDAHGGTTAIATLTVSAPTLTAIGGSR